MARKPRYYEGMSSEEYWKKRAEDLDKASKKAEDKFLKEVSSIYKKAFLDAKKELYEFYDKYSKENNITMQEAIKELTPADAREHQKKLKELKELYDKTGNEYYLREYKKLSSRIKVTRFHKLLDNINTELTKATGDAQIAMEDYLLGLYTTEHKEFLELFGIENKDYINSEIVDKIINYPYAGKQFSDRIWANKDALLGWIEQDLATGLIRGLSIQKMAKALMDRLETAYYQSERLVRTETNYILNQAHLQGYKDAGLGRYRIDAHLDSRTSKICRQLDGKVFNIEDAVVGVNMPCFHPNCRTRIVPVVEDIKAKYNLD